jgi:hypothetical protein
MLLCMLMLMLMQICMRRIYPPDILRLLYGLDIWQIHSDRLAITPHQHTFQLLVLARVDLLMRHPRRHVDEIARAGLSHKLKTLAPAHPRLALEDVDDALEVAVVVRASLGVGMDRDGAGPELLSSDTRKVDGGCARHAGCLGGVGVEAVGGDDGDAGVFPFRGGVGRHWGVAAGCHGCRRCRYSDIELTG